MTKALTKILVADNDEDHLKLIAGILREEGQYQYLVFATRPDEARAVIDSGEVDLAILDLRLENDLSETDISGLTVAKETNPSVPKIIVTNHPNESLMRKALGANVDGLPSAIAFLYKGELLHELLPKVALALEINKSRFRRSQEQIAGRLIDDYDHAKRVAQFHIYLSFVLAIIFVIPVIYGVYHLHGSHTAGNALAMVFILVGSLGAEITNYIVARKLEFLYERVDRFHTEWLQANKLDQLLALCDEIDEAAERRKFKASILAAVLERWKDKDESSLQITTQTNSKKLKIPTVSRKKASLNLPSQKPSLTSE